MNCISTEFTPKKHGGEKGVPFRIQVETYVDGNSEAHQKYVHAAACQIKVSELNIQIALNCIRCDIEFTVHFHRFSSLKELIENISKIVKEFRNVR